MKRVDLVSSKESSRTVYRRILSYLRPHRRLFFCSLIAMTAYGLTDGIVPLLIRSLLDDIFGNRNQAILWELIAFLLAFGIMRGAVGFLQEYLTALVGLRVVEDLRNSINQRLLFLSPSFFGRRTSGDLLATVATDTLLVRTAITDAIASLLRDTIRVIVLIGVALYLDPILGVIALVGFPVGLLPVIHFGRRIRRLSRTGQDQFGRLTGLLQESIQGHKVVRAFNMEEFEQARFVAENKRISETLARAAKYGALSAPVNEFVGCAAIAVVVLYGAISVMNNTRTEGDFIAFLAAMFLLYEPLKKLGRLNSIIQTGIAAAQRVFSILDAPTEIIESPNALTLSVKRPRIQYSNVSFRYPPRAVNGSGEGPEESAEWTLANITFSVRPGETLALVGMSGGGKSTIVNLLPRFYEPQEGQILIDGVDICDVTLASLRNSLAIVSQHTFLFNDTVFNNIRYGRLNADPEEVYAAARAANAYQFIERLPQGFDTAIGEQGLSLSGGERARIAIARALLKNAPILILDEATAALDSESEALVQSAIDRVMEGRTVLVIAHRLATVRKANAIAVVSHGQIVESGTHEELILRNGEYAKFHRMQFRDQNSLHVVGV